MIVVLNPAPFLLKLRAKKVDPPPSFLLDFLKDGENFLLFFGNDQTFCCYGETAQGETGNAPERGQKKRPSWGTNLPVFDVSNNPAYLSRVG